jgi:hypothetical protein
LLQPSSSESGAGWLHPSVWHLPIYFVVSPLAFLIQNSVLVPSLGYDVVSFLQRGQPTLISLNVWMLKGTHSCTFYRSQWSLVSLLRKTRHTDRHGKAQRGSLTAEREGKLIRKVAAGKKLYKVVYRWEIYCKPEGQMQNAHRWLRQVKQRARRKAAPLHNTLAGRLICIKTARVWGACVDLVVVLIQGECYNKRI